MPGPSQSRERLDEAALRRLAVQLATQLPATREDAMTVVRYLAELVDFMAPGTGTNVLPFR